MIIEEGKFYFIKDEYFELFAEYDLMENKESCQKRPCYFCFRDKKNKEIIWFVPLSTKYQKYKDIYEKKKSKKQNKAVYNFVFGNVLGKKTVFLIQNMFPILDTYIKEKYINSNKDVCVAKSTQAEILKTSFRVLALAERDIHVPFYNIIELKNKLLKMY